MVKYQIDTQNVELSETDREMMDKKIDRLEKFLKMPYVMDVRITRSTHHLSGEVFNCIINLEHKKDVFHTERTGGSVQVALDESIESLTQELKKNNDKSIKRGRWIKRLIRRG